MAKRRKLGKIISVPISELVTQKNLDSILFIETDHYTAEKTRAAACMFIGRNEYDLTTKVEDNQIWILKDKDVEGQYNKYDLRVTA